MRIHNLEDPIFTQADVLKILPDLTAKNLQNWAERGLLDIDNPRPGRQGKRLYTAVGVIMLAAMNRMVKFGLGPTDARDLVDPIAECAVQLWRRAPDEEGQHGERKIVHEYGKLVTYRRGYVVRRGDAYAMNIQTEPFQSDLSPHQRLGLPWDYHVIEIDLMVIGLLNKLHRLVSGLDPHTSDNDPPPPASKSSSEGKKGRRK